MKRLIALGLLAGSLTLGAPASAAAQDASGFLAVGEMAPDIEVVGVTQDGIMDDVVRLSDFRGETVVLAFFFRVRTRG